jgi:hypothetical protein
MPSDSRTSVTCDKALRKLEEHILKSSGGSTLRKQLPRQRIQHCVSTMTALKDIKRNGWREGWALVVPSSMEPTIATDAVSVSATAPITDIRGTELGNRCAL